MDLFRQRRSRRTILKKSARQYSPGPHLLTPHDLDRVADHKHNRDPVLTGGKWFESTAAHHLRCRPHI